MREQFAHVRSLRELVKPNLEQIALPGPGQHVRQCHPA
jgi:hypothetical protein